MAAVEQPAVSNPGRTNNKETEKEIKLTSNGIDHPHNNFDAAQSLKQKMSMAGAGSVVSGADSPVTAQSPNGSSAPHDSNGGPGHPYPGPGYYPGYGPPPKGYPGHPPYNSQPGGAPGPGPTPTLTNLLQDRGAAPRFPGGYEPGPGGPPPPGGPPGGYPGWGYPQGHPHQYRGPGQVNIN